MSVLSVAKKDFIDVRRSKMIWFVGGIYTLFAILFFYFGQSGATDPSVRQQLLRLSGIGALFIPLIALIAAYLAIAGERESGSIRYLLSVPNSRRDIVLGKFLSRAVIVSASIVMAFGVGAVLALVWYPSLPTADFTRVVALILLYTLTYVAVAIGVSAMTGSRSRAMAGAIGFFFVTNVLMLFGGFSIIGGLDYVFNDFLGLGVTNSVLELIRAVVSPTTAYIDALPLAFTTDMDAGMTPGNGPFYLEPGVMVLILIGWILIPIVTGIWRFNRANLG